MLPFSDLLVLELASVLAGPSVGQFFAELGARVIKLENLSTHGDVTRKWKLAAEAKENDRPAYFWGINWGKESVAADLRQPQGLELVQQLAAKADVVIASYKPGDAEKLGVDYASLSALNPQLIYGEITGYGPGVNRAGYDAVLQAETGFMYLNGTPESEPTKMPVALIDVLAGHQLKEGILTALYLRERTNKGNRVQVSLLGAGLASLVNQATNFLAAGHNPQRMGSGHPTIVPYGTVYTTADNRQLVLAVGDDRQFANLCQVLQLTELPLDERYKTNQARVKNRNELEQILTLAISGQQQQPLLQKLISLYVPAGAVNDVKTVLSDPANAFALIQPETTAETPPPGLRGVAFAFGAEPMEAKLAPPPHFAQHTQPVLEQVLGLSAGEIADLERARVISTRSQD